MSSPLSQAFAQNFLGHSPRWYKLTVLAFLLLNPLLLWLAGPVTSAWVLVGEFIFTLAMALKCYPLQPGGLLVLEALLLGLATPEALYAELQHNFPVLLLLMFMVAGIYFMKDLLLLLFPACCSACARRPCYRSCSACWPPSSRPSSTPSP